MTPSPASPPSTKASDGLAVVLAFGDSLTWGRDPVSGGRHALSDRWPTVLAAGLPGVEVIAEGLRGRMTAFDQTAGAADMNGARILPVLLHSHAPLDLVIVMLGTNDIYYGQMPERVGDGYVRIAEVIRGHGYRLDDYQPPVILFVAPPPIVIGADPRATDEMVDRSHRVTAFIREAAAEAQVAFFDAGIVAQSSPLDSTHMDVAATRALGEALRPVVSGMLAARAAQGRG